MATNCIVWSLELVHHSASLFNSIAAEHFAYLYTSILKEFFIHNEDSVWIFFRS